MSWAWLGHATILIRRESGEALYLDPFDLREKRWPPADLVLLTNPRAGFRSDEDIEAVRAPGGLVAGPADALAGIPQPVRVLAPGDCLRHAGFEVSAVPAYTPDTGFFPRGAGWLGYLVAADGVVHYHAGATGRIPEMEGLRADVAFLPVSGRYVMGEEDARQVAAAIGAREVAALVVPGDRFRPVPGFGVRSGS